MLQPRRNTTITKILPKRSESLEQSAENYKLLRASALRGSGVKSGYKPDLRSPEETRPAYDELRASAKPGFKVNTGYVPDSRNPEDVMLDYKKVRGIEVVKAASGAQILGAAAPFANFIPVVGPAVSAVMAGGAALWGASDAKRARRRAQLQGQAGQYNATTMEQDVYAKQFVDENRSDLPVYSKGGTMNNSYRTVKKYELGSTIEENQDVSLVNSNESSSTGKLDAVGGDLIPVSDNAEVVSGNTHKQNNIDGSYGVTLSENGQPVANVEDKEVIVDNNLVFSDKLKKGNQTFADIALQVNTKIGELQDKLKGAKSNAEKFSIERTIQGLQKSNQDLFNEQEVVKRNTTGDEQETVKVEDGIVPKGANGLRLPGDPNKPDWMKDMNKLVYGTKPTPVSTLKATTFKPELSNTVGDIPKRMRNTYAEDLEGITDKKSDVIGQIAPLIVDNITNAIIADKMPAPARPTIRRAPVIDTTINVQPQLADIAKAVGTSKANILGNTSSSNVARAAMTTANLRGAELSGDVYAKKDAIERDLKNKQNIALVEAANVNAGLLDDYREDVREHTLAKQAAQSKNVSNAISDYQAVKQAGLLDKQSQDILNLSLLDDPTGEKMRRFRRLGKGLSNEDKIMLLKEIQRKK